MVKSVTFDPYDETTARAVVNVLRQWPGAGPAEMVVGINGVQFRLTGDANSPNPNAYIEGLFAQANALQKATTVIVSKK